MKTIDICFSDITSFDYYDINQLLNSNKDTIIKEEILDISTKNRFYEHISERICMKATSKNELIGIVVGVMYSDYVEIKIVIDKKHQGKGIGTNILYVFLKGIESYNYKKFKYGAYVENIPSIKLALNAGFIITEILTANNRKIVRFLKEVK